MWNEYQSQLATLRNISFDSYDLMLDAHEISYKYMGFVTRANRLMALAFIFSQRILAEKQAYHKYVQSPELLRSNYLHYHA